MTNERFDSGSDDGGGNVASPTPVSNVPPPPIESLPDSPISQRDLIIELSGAVKTLSGGVDKLAKKSWWDRLLVRIVIVVSIASLLLVVGLLRTSLNTCHTGNTFRQNETQLWSYILNLPPTHVYTPEEIKQRKDATVYIAKIFAQRDCSLTKTLIP